MADNSAVAGDWLEDAKSLLPEIIVTDHTSTDGAKQITNGATAHPSAQSSEVKHGFSEDEAAAVLRQMEHYFSDENLPGDAHLLGMFEKGNGLVSFNEICGWRAMRGWCKPASRKKWVHEVLKDSTLIELVGDSKHPQIRRRIPLQKPLTVTPKLNNTTSAGLSRPVPEDKPWLTRGMMKPTGFEEAGDGAELEDDLSYDPEEPFTLRIETAIARFCARRTMHQNFKQIFDKFLAYGGFRSGQAMFIGGLDGKDGKKLTAREKAEQTAQHTISTSVIDGLEDGEDGTAALWSVDFVAIVKGFLSSHFPAYFPWYDEATVKTATNVLRNFNNFLLTHKVCPEYDDQIIAAIEVCNVAEKELPKLAMVDRHLPGGFNMACSMLFFGHHSDQLMQGNWAQGTEGGSWNLDEAWAVFRASVYAHGTPKQIKQVQMAQDDRQYFGAASELKVGLETISIEMPNRFARSIYEAARERNPIIKAMGKLRCREWRVPTASPMDLPPDARDARCKPDPNAEYEFLLEASTLEFCYPGCKIEATIKWLAPGFTWIDYVGSCHASFYTWLANEVNRRWKEPGPPKAWMERQNEKKKLKRAVGAEVKEVAVDDGGEDDEDDYDELDW